MKRLSLVLALATLGCGGGYVVDGTQELYLLTNLRPNARGVMTSVLQWRGTSVLPVCTPVQIGGVNSREIRFRDRTTGQVYRYLLHRSTRSPIEEHVNRYFGPQCPNLAGYSPIDQQGIQAGQVLPGMSKQGVILAVGYPPEHQTPSLEGPTWTYWGDRSRVQVQFSGDIVAAVGDPNTQAQPAVVEPQPQPQPAGPPVIGPDGYPVSQGPAPVQGSATVTVQAGGYPQQQAPPPSATVQVQTAPAGATVTVQTDQPNRRARRRRRRRRAAVGVAVGGTVVAGAAVASQPRQRTVSRRRSTTRTSGCSSLTINGSVYTDHPNTPMGQSCDGGGCPASYVCVMPLGVCVPEDGQRCHE